MAKKPSSAPGITRRKEVIETISVPRSVVEDILTKQFGKDGTTVAFEWGDDPDAWCPFSEVRVILKTLNEGD